MKIDYAFYPTLLDSFVYYKKTDDENKFVELFEKINKVKRIEGEAQTKGIEFEGLINSIVSKKEVNKQHQFYITENHRFNADIVEKIACKLSRTNCIQKREEAIIETPFGNVKLYAIFDYTFPEMYVDLKTTLNYSFGKYEDNMQHKFAAKILPELKQFNYVVTDFEYMYIENYHCNQELKDDLIYEICDFISFIEHYKHLITDLKIFGK